MGNFCYGRLIGLLGQALVSDWSYQRLPDFLMKGGFVSAILSAGFHVELAGGGHYSPEALRAKVTEIQSKIPPGVGITYF